MAIQSSFIEHKGMFGHTTRTGVDNMRKNNAVGKERELGVRACACVCVCVCV